MDERLPGDIARLADLFAAGGWQELRVEGAGIGVLLSNDRQTPSLGQGAVAALPAAPVADAVIPAVARPVRPAAAPAAERAADPGWSEVRAPNLGTFYRSPKPGAAPFVDVGQRVDGDTELCLLEVMKLFTSVKAGLRGTIRQVCVEDGVLVEGGQLLFLVEAD